jgi:peptidoglycan/xylan/chitin deacetylase (PgdA/CDA1 family)
VIKKFVLGPALEGAFRLGFLDLVGRRRAAGRVAVLMYHRIVSDQGPDGLDRFNPMTDTLTESRFEAQVRWLAARTTVIGLDDLIDIKTGQKQSPSSAVVITFDDGFKDTLELAAPILTRHGLTAVVFASVQAVDQRRPILVDELTWRLSKPEALLADEDLPDEIVRLCQGLDTTDIAARHRAVTEATWWLKNLDPAYQAVILGRLRAAAPGGQDYFDRLYLSWDDLGDLTDQGWEVGSHGLSHANLNFLSGDDLEAELVRSREMIADRLGRAVDTFCYPYGDYDERVRAATARAGYALAFSTRPGPSGPDDDPLALRRVSTGGRRLASFAAKVYGLRT